MTEGNRRPQDQMIKTGDYRREMTSTATRKGAAATKTERLEKVS